MGPVREAMATPCQWGTGLTWSMTALSGPPIPLLVDRLEPFLPTFLPPVSEQRRACKGRHVGAGMRGISDVRRGSSARMKVPHLQSGTSACSPHVKAGPSTGFVSFPLTRRSPICPVHVPRQRMKLEVAFHSAFRRDSNQPLDNRIAAKMSLL